MLRTTALAAIAVVGLLFINGITAQVLSRCYIELGCGGRFILSISLCDCCVNLNGYSFDDAGTCRPCIVHGFNQSVFDVGEESRLDTEFALNVVGTTPFETLVVSGTITAEAAGTASSSDFEELRPIFVNLNNASRSTDVRLFNVNDEITLEFEDRVLLRFNPGSEQLILNLEGVNECIRDTATVNIIDNDRLQINFGEADYSIMEGSNRLSSNITLQLRYNQNPFTVRLSPVTVFVAESMGLGFFINSGTITNDSRATVRDTPDPDFSAGTIDVQIPAGSRVFNVSTFFTINEDNIDEDTQSFAIVAEILDVPENISCFQTAPGTIPCFGTRGATEIRITDNDPMFIGFTQRIRTVCECDALPGEDFFQIEIQVATLRTAEREHPMVFRLQMSVSTAIVEPRGDQGNILLDAAFATRDEPNGPIQEEFDLERLMATIPLLIADIRNDLRAEEEECFTIRIFPVDVPGRRELFECYEDEDGQTNFFCETTICIEDDDEIFMVALVEKTYTVDESVGEVEICVNLTNPVTDILDETVNVFVVDDPSSIYIPPGAPLATPDEPNFISQYPMEEGTDFAQQTRAVNVIDGIIITEVRRIICYNQPIYDDPCLEPDEYAGLTLGVIDDNDFDRTTVRTEVVPSCDQAAILIVDNDRARVGLKQTFFRVTEDVGVIELCANVSEPDIECPIKFPFNVQLYTADESAVETMDYGALDVILMFDECERCRCVNVSITQDLVDEPDEIFTFHLNRTTGLSPRIELDPVNGTIEIVDDDEPIEVGYDPVLYVTTESTGFVDLTIRVFSHPGGSPQPFSLAINTEDGTARVVDGDYQSVTDQIIIFEAGDVTRTHRIQINNDNECEKEPNEIFFSNISLNTNNPDIIVIEPQATVIINDTAEPECEPIEVGYDPVSYVTTETAENVDLTIRVFSHPGGSPRSFSLAINTEDGTARVVDGDYQRVTDQIIMFEAGDVTRTHRIQINNDTECEKEPNETFFSNLALSSGIPDIFVTEPRATVTIDDTAEPECEPIEVGYDPVSYVTTETAGFVDLTIRVFSHPGGSPRPFSLAINTEDGTARVVDGDYQGVTDQIIMFEAGDVTQTHRIIINDDTECETPQNENFFSNIALNSGIPDIFVTEPRATVTIDDTSESNCGGVFVNDTLTGDPLMTVPIWSNLNVEPGSEIESLCYEVHGKDREYFNLISDECTSVNAYYQEAVTPSENIDLNVVTSIGVRARGPNRCWNIRVDLENCSATVNDTPLLTGSTFDDITVRPYPSSSRVRISVPNCADNMLVMWVFCRAGEVEDPVTWVYYPIRYIRFVVMRGLNLNEHSHGIIGQFWNVPITVSPYTGLFGGVQRMDDYVINVTHPDYPDEPRSFVGLKSDITWEFERRVCYYVGNNQAGKLGEVDDPNDSVIQGEYSEYAVESLFATEFKYNRFNAQC